MACKIVSTDLLRLILDLKIDIQNALSVSPNEVLDSLLKNVTDLLFVYNNTIGNPNFYEVFNYVQNLSQIEFDKMKIDLRRFLIAFHRHDKTYLCEMKTYLCEMTRIIKNILGESYIKNIVWEMFDIIYWYIQRKSDCINNKYSHVMEIYNNIKNRKLNNGNRKKKYLNMLNEYEFGNLHSEDEMSDAFRKHISNLRSHLYYL